jgi:hypothetical protein
MNSEIVVLLSTISTGLIALIGLCIRYAFLSKCIRVKLCCCEFERDIESEMKTTEQHINVIPSSPSNRNLTRI